MAQNAETRLLKILKNAKSDFVSGEDLSRRLRVSRSAVWKHIESLRGAGFEILASPHHGYRYLASPDRVVADEILAELDTRVIGREVVSFETIDSTNRLALDRGREGAKEGLVVFAEAQTRGRGRLGRTWSSPKAKGLYFSVLLRPVLEVKELPKITLTAAVAVAKALEETCGIDALIRWPNDLLIGGEKIAGILTEMSAESDRILFLVIGIGLNVHEGGGLPPGAASLEKATGRRWSRPELAVRILTKLDDYYHLLNEGRFKELALLWEKSSAISGRSVSAKTLRGEVKGTAMGIDDDGALWIRQNSGIQVKLLSGDVTLLR